MAVLAVLRRDGSEDHQERGHDGDLAASVLRKKTAQFIIDNIAK